MRFSPLLPLVFSLLGACALKVEEADIFGPEPLPEQNLGFLNTDINFDDSRIGIRLNFPLTPQTDDRPVIVFFHGNSGNVVHWSPFTYRLAQSDARVIAVDYPGFGVSDGTPSLEGMRLSGLKVLTYLFDNKILTKDDTLVLYGLSLGSHPALWLASDPSRVDQFGLDGLIVEAGLSNVEDMVVHIRSRISLNFLIRPQISERIVINNDELIQNTPLNVYLLHGTKDQQIPPWMSQRLAVAAGAQLYDLWYVQGAGHTQPAFVAEEEFDRRLKAYLTFASH